MCQGGSLIYKMDHLACFVGGMFVLGSKYSDNPDAHMKAPPPPRPRPAHGAARRRRHGATR